MHFKSLSGYHNYSCLMQLRASCLAHTKKNKNVFLDSGDTSTVFTKP